MEFVFSSREAVLISEEELMDVKALRRQGLTYAEIGRLLGRDWRTVKRYVEQGAQPVYRRRRAPSKLDQFKPLIDQWLAGEPRLLATRIHQDLVRDYGFQGGYNTVRRYVERTRPRREPRVEERFETAPGHQAQVDWSHEQPIRTTSGLELPLFCFHMVLGHSRDSFCALTGSQDLVTFWACHRAAFAHFGGAPAGCSMTAPRRSCATTSGAKWRSANESFTRRRWPRRTTMASRCVCAAPTGRRRKARSSPMSPTCASGYYARTASQAMRKRT